MVVPKPLMDIVFDILYNNLSPYFALSSPFCSNSTIQNPINQLRTVMFWFIARIVLFCNISCVNLILFVSCGNLMVLKFWFSKYTTQNNICQGKQS